MHAVPLLINDTNSLSIPICFWRIFKGLESLSPDLHCFFLGFFGGGGTSFFKRVQYELKEWRAQRCLYKVKVWSDSSTLNRSHFPFMDNCVLGHSGFYFRDVNLHLPPDLCFFTSSLCWGCVSYKSLQMTPCSLL